MDVVFSYIECAVMPLFDEVVSIQGVLQVRWWHKRLVVAAVLQFARFQVVRAGIRVKRVHKTGLLHPSIRTCISTKQATTVK
jgi:hypothetical protein